MLKPASYGCISHVEEGDMKSLVIKQEPLDDDFSSGTVSIPQSGSIRIKDNEECGPPAKCLKYDNVSKFLTQNVASGTWIKIDRIALTFVDKQMIIDGEKLHDKLIQFGQSMIHHQFPDIGGLRSTLLQHRYSSRNSIQAVFCKTRQHWVVASKIHAACKSFVYDSVFNELDDESLLLVKTMFSDSSSSMMKVEMANMLKQRGAVIAGCL